GLDSRDKEHVISFLLRPNVYAPRRNTGRNSIIEGGGLMFHKCCLIMFFSYVTTAGALSAQSSEPPKLLLSDLYIIQPNDVLSIFVWKEPNLSEKVTVRPDGRISFPLVQDMQAAGLNPGQLKNKIEESLREYIEVPNVTVIVEAIQSYKIYVTGKVGKPGAIMSEKQISVLQEISMAGGFLEFANQSETVIIRNTAEGTTT